VTTRRGTFADRQRGNRHERGYGTAWEKLRLQVLQRDCHICQCPDCLGGVKRLRPASEVDHVVPKAQGGRDELTNLRAVHPECHRRLTLAQRGFKRRPRTGVDGWPIDD
jgi:5-methylcytosine-specific restriction protein A